MIREVVLTVDRKSRRVAAIETAPVSLLIEGDEWAKSDPRGTQLLEKKRISLRDWTLVSLGSIELSASLCELPNGDFAVRKGVKDAKSGPQSVARTTRQENLVASEATSQTEIAVKVSGGEVALDADPSGTAASKPNRAPLRKAVKLCKDASKDASRETDQDAGRDTTAQDPAFSDEIESLFF
jgi:hypothetical protein